MTAPLPDDPKDLMKPREVAELLRIHLVTVYEWHKSGKLPGQRLGGTSLRFRRSDVEALLQPTPTPSAQ